MLKTLLALMILGLNIFDVPIIAGEEEEESSSTSTTDWDKTPAPPGVTLPTLLNDEEEELTREFLHEGLSERVYDEGCKDNKSICDGATQNVTNAMGDQLIEAVAKMYGMFALFVQSEYKTKAPPNRLAQTPAAGADGEGKKPPGDKKSEMDYCGAIPMAVEAAASGYQMTSLQSLDAQPMPEGTEQRESILKAARSHKIRKNAATIQVTGWGATTACYVYKIAKHMGAGKVDYLKLAASAGLTTFYAFKRKKSADAEEKLKSLANSLPKKGDCNPISEVHCYCAQPETEDDPKYCVPEAYGDRDKTPKIVHSCIDKDLKEDEKCQCSLTSSCYDYTYKAMTKKIKLNPDNEFNSNVFKPLSDVMNSRIDGAQANLQGVKQAAIAKQLLQTKKAPDLTRAPTKNESKQARFLKDKLGLPRAFAMALATRKASAKTQSIKNKLKKMGVGGMLLDGNVVSGKTTNSASKGKKAWYFASTNQKKSTKKNNQFNFNKFMKKKKKKKIDPNSRIFRFGQMAQKNTSVHKGKQVSLFELKHQRYVKTFWGKLKVGN